MTDSAPQVFAMDLADKGGRIVFRTPDDIRKWSDDEEAKWVWMNEAAKPMSDWVVSSRNEFFAQTRQHQLSWRQYLAHPNEVTNVLRGLQSVFERYPLQGRVLLSTSPAAAFVFELRQRRGDRIALGAYAALVDAQGNTGGHMQSALIEGIVEAFLFKREIDWTASAHQSELDRLRKQYDGEIEQQNARFKDLEATNHTLNTAFDTSLKQNEEALRKLHTTQSSEFTEMTAKHVQNLAAIEKTYDQKLALHSPVKYWNVKEGYHRKRAICFGGVALGSALAAVGTLVWLAYKYLGQLQPNQDPKHWQIGLLVVSAFFSIWLVRVFVRLFFSHVHLATDAAERRMMILTYLSMSRKGTQFTAEDKMVIVQHIFRAASDGLVKDDAAPPTMFELLTRK